MLIVALLLVAWGLRQLLRRCFPLPLVPVPLGGRDILPGLFGSSLTPACRPAFLRR